MNHCLRNGGIAVIEAHEEGYECDLHTWGNCVLIITTYPATSLEVLKLKHNSDRIILRVPEEVDCFVRHTTPYGFILLKQEDCIITKELQKHIAEWYPEEQYFFQREE